MRPICINDLNPYLKSFLYITGGEIAIYIGIELLNSASKDITDEDITENIKLSIKDTDIDFEPDDPEILKLNRVRKTLYKLYSEKLAQFRRIRDKSTGWFIYYWWHEFDLFEEIFIGKKKLAAMKLRQRLSFEEKNYFFSCKNCQKINVKYNFDDAFELNFKCPDCGSPLEAQDNQTIIEFLKNKLALVRKLKIFVN